MEYYTSTVCHSENWEPLWWKRVAAQNLQQHGQHAVWALRSSCESSIRASRFELPGVLNPFQFSLGLTTIIAKSFWGVPSCWGSGQRNRDNSPQLHFQFLSTSFFFFFWNMGPASWLSCHALVYLSPLKTRCWFQHKPSKAPVKKK